MRQLSCDQTRPHFGEQKPVGFVAAQFAVQIVTALRWEEMSKCKGVENFAEFKKVIEEVNGIDIDNPMFRLRIDAQPQSAVADELGDFICRQDALLELLDRTADSLAAECDLRNEPVGEEEWPDGEDRKPTIQ
jgi:hypothetical protein